MRGKGNSNPLLMEIMIAVLFLALCSTAIMEVFGFVKGLNEKAQLRSNAAAHVQDIGEQLYACDDAEEFLASQGFVLNGDHWQKECDDYMICVSVSEEATAAGMLVNAQIDAVLDEEVVAGIPCVRYHSGKVE